MSKKISLVLSCVLVRCFLWDQVHATTQSIVSYENELHEEISATVNQDVNVDVEYSDLTIEDQVLRLGCGFPDKSVYNPKLFSEKAKEKLIEKGLAWLKANINDISSEMLSRYYYHKGDISKGLYWAKVGAEKGSDHCMSVLRLAYTFGHGVIEDQVEAIKWVYLAAAKGSNDEKEMLHNLIVNARSPHDNSILEQGKKKAKEWSEKHPEAFFDPN